jgi:hypothetical protein
VFLAILWDIQDRTDSRVREAAEELERTERADGDLGRLGVDTNIVAESGQGAGSAAADIELVRRGEPFGFELDEGCVKGCGL